MFIQTQETPNPNSLKFLPGKGVSNDGPYEFLNENQTEIPILKNILSINGVTGIFLSGDFLSINKTQDGNFLVLSKLLSKNKSRLTILDSNLNEINLLDLENECNCCSIFNCRLFL